MKTKHITTTVDGAITVPYVVYTESGIAKVKKIRWRELGVGRRSLVHTIRMKTWCWKNRCSIAVNFHFQQAVSKRGSLILLMWKQPLW